VKNLLRDHNSEAGSAGQFMAGDERGQPVGIIADTDQEV
jgi:hypothetical protein